MFCLCIPGEGPGERHRKAVLNDLLSLKATSLLFLRKVRTIEVTIEAGTGIPTRSFRLQREDLAEQKLGLSNFKMAMLSVGESIDPISRTRFRWRQATRCIVEERVALNMPLEPRRQDVSDSTVVLAFPITEDGYPIIAAREVFNFLPVRPYGFPVRDRDVQLRHVLIFTVLCASRLCTERQSARH